MTWITRASFNVRVPLNSLRVFENGVLRRIFGSKRGEVTGSGEKYIIRSLMICTAHQILFG